MSPTSRFLQEISARGFINQATDLEALDAELNEGMITGYIGFDATATSLHVGNLIQIMILYWLQETGHRPIVIVGGGTTKVGDPSGKDEMRQMLTSERIQGNIERISSVFGKILNFESGANKALFLNNDAWLNDLNYLDFLRDFGPHFSINRMMAMESVKGRLDREQNLSFLEFNYMILQAYDFMELNKRHNCVLQMGGSDQWGNIISGVDLTRRVNQKTVFGLTTPLITTSDGKKMGKTAQGAVWLNGDMLSPYDFWQFWRNTTDADVGRFLRLYTRIPLEEIAKLERLEGSQINDAKKILADAVTEMIHGKDAVLEARNTAEKLFESKDTLDLSALPTMDVTPDQLIQGLPIIDVLVTLGLATSKGEARRLIKGSGARLNDVALGDENQTLSQEDFLGENIAKLSAGKKRHGLARLVG